MIKTKPKLNVCIFIHYSQSKKQVRKIIFDQSYKINNIKRERKSDLQITKSVVLILVK